MGKKRDKKPKMRKLRNLNLIIFLTTLFLIGCESFETKPKSEDLKEDEVVDKGRAIQSVLHPFGKLNNKFITSGWEKVAK